jgi:NAD(P)-dependent dehydrogenase (short-subunit alcohol dehydrogenase family)
VQPGKVAIVTGDASRVGEAISEIFATHGVRRRCSTDITMSASLQYANDRIRVVPSIPGSRRPHSLLRVFVVVASRSVAHLAAMTDQDFSTCHDNARVRLP